MLIASISQGGTDLAVHVSENSTYLLRAINAAITFQALVFASSKVTSRGNRHSTNRKPFVRKFGWAETMSMSSWKQEVNGMVVGGETIQNFVSQNFYQMLLSMSLVPDKHTYEVIH